MTKTLSWAFVLLLAVGGPVQTSATAAAAKQTGIASVYANALKGRRMANGERYDPGKLTAAHRTLPLGTRIRVTNPENKQSIVLRIADRGPYRRSRILDLSAAAASRLGLSRRGVHRVTMEVLGHDDVITSDE
jgi:peptidoglycan lytic transglycosylase